MDEINDECYKDIKYIENYENKSISQTNSNLNTVSNNLNNNLDGEKTKMENSISKNTEIPIYKEAEKYKIIELLGIMGTHKNIPEYIKELSNGYFISGGTDNNPIFYKENFEPENKLEIKDMEDWVYNIIERKNVNNKEDKCIQLIGCCSKDISLFTLDFKNKHLNIKKYQIGDLSILNCIEMGEDNFIIIGQYSSTYIFNLFSQTLQIKQNIIVKRKTFRNAIRLNDSIIAMTSNKVVFAGEDKILFYNTKDENQRIKTEINGYSFICSTNGLTLIPDYEVKQNNKILLCACKKYLEDQKNGILLINIQSEEGQKKNYNFYDTGNFEVYCFCHIFIIPENKIIHDNDNKIKIKYTDFFFVGGYDRDKCEGRIKLYKIKFSHKDFNNSIKYLQDIEFERNESFEEFDGPISSIIQSKYNGNIVATCYDKNVYLFTRPNLEFYLKNY